MIPRDPVLSAGAVDDGGHRHDADGADSAGPPRPDEQAQGRETQQRLARAIGRLPAEFRAALLLRVEEGLSFRQIAEVLALTEETARWRVFKARQRLLNALAPQPVRGMLPPTRGAACSPR